MDSSFSKPASSSNTVQELFRLEDSPYIAYRHQAFAAQEAASTRIAPLSGFRDCFRLAVGGQAEVIAGTDLAGLKKAVKVYRYRENKKSAMWLGPQESVLLMELAHDAAWGLMPLEGVFELESFIEEAGDAGICLIMPLCPIGTLEDRLAWSAVPVVESVAALLGIMAAIQALHSRELIHADLKPSNVFYWNGDFRDGGSEEDTTYRICVSDLGSALISSQLNKLDHERHGSLRFEAPECSSAAPLTSAVDIWAWGAIAVELFLGRDSWKPPMAVDGPEGLQARLAAAQCPAWLSLLLVAAISSIPHDRPDARVLLAAFSKHCAVYIHEDCFVGAPDASIRIWCPTLCDYLGKQSWPEGGKPMRSLRLGTGVSRVLKLGRKLADLQTQTGCTKAMALIERRFQDDGGADSLFAQFFRNPHAAVYQFPPQAPGTAPHVVPPQRIELIEAAAIYCDAMCSLIQSFGDAALFAKLRQFSDQWNAAQIAMAPNYTITLAKALILADCPRDGLALLPPLERHAPETYDRMHWLMTLDAGLMSIGDLEGALAARHAMSELALAQNRLQLALSQTCGELALYAKLGDVEKFSAFVMAAASEAHFPSIVRMDFFLAANYFLSPDDIEISKQLEELLHSTAFFAPYGTLEKYWIGCACLAKHGDIELAQRIARNVLADFRFSLLKNRPFKTALRALAATGQPAGEDAEDDPARAMRLTHHARMLVSAGRYSEVAAVYRTFDSQFPWHEQYDYALSEARLHIAYALATASRALGNPVLEMAMLEEARNASRYFHCAQMRYYYLFVTLFTGGRLEDGGNMVEAYRLYDEVIANDAGTDLRQLGFRLDALAYRSILHYEAGDFFSAYRDVLAASRIASADTGIADFSNEIDQLDSTREAVILRIGVDPFVWERLPFCEDALMLLDTVIENLDDEDCDSQMHRAFALNCKGVVLNGLGRHEAAGATYDALLQRYGSENSEFFEGQVAIALIRKAAAVADMGRFDEELNLFESVIARFGESDTVILKGNVGCAYDGKTTRLAALGRVDDALATCNEEIARFCQEQTPELVKFYAEALLKKAEILGNVHEHASAVDCYSTLVDHFGDAATDDLQEDLAIALYNKGLALSVLGRHDEAMAAYSDIEARFGRLDMPIIRPHLSAAQQKICKRLYELKRFEETIASCDLFITRFGDASEADIREELAYVLVIKHGALEKLGRTEEAMAVIETIFQSFAMDQHPEAVKAIEIAIEIRSGKIMADQLKKH